MRETSLSIIIPALNEASGIAESLQHLQILRRRGHEIILADGGSNEHAKNKNVLSA